MKDNDLTDNVLAPVAVLALRTVKIGLEGKFEEALHGFISQSLQTSGQLGVSVVRPVEGSGSREYGILRRFQDAASRDRFYESSLFKEWEIKVALLTEGEPKHQNLSGLETWFVLPGQRAVIPPPRWKMAIVTLIGVWPTSIFVPWALTPVISGMSMPVQALFVAAGIVILLTWVVMPTLVKIFNRWL